MTKDSRSAKSGHYVKESFAKTHPATTVSENRGGQPTGRARDAGSGRFVTDTYAKRHPSTTVREDK